MFVQLEEEQAKGPPNPDPNQLVHIWVPKTPMWDFVEDKKSKPKPAPAKLIETAVEEESEQAKPPANPDPNQLVHIWVPKTPMWDYIEDKKSKPKPAPAKFIEMEEEEEQAKPPANPDPNQLVKIWVPKTPMWDYIEDKKSKPKPAPAKFVEMEEEEEEEQAKPAANPDPNPAVKIWVPKTPMWDDIKDKKAKPAPAKAKLMETSEETSEELTESNPEPSYFLEQSYLNKVAADFLKHPASDKINDAVTKLEEYTFLGLLENTLIPFIFGDDTDLVKDYYAQCAVQLGGKLIEDNESQNEIYNSLHEFCYKPNKEKVLFTVMQAYAHVFFKDLKECHDIWSMSGLERQADVVAGQINKLMAHMDGIDDYYDLHEHEITKENHADANPTDPATKAGLEAWLEDWNEVKSGWSGFKSGVRNLGGHLTNQVKNFDKAKTVMDESNLYNSILRQHKENILQSFAVTSKYADFYCDNQEEVAHHMRKSMDEWNRIMSEYMEVIRDDKFP